ncbi:MULTISPECIES: class II aldolase and adducin N-terminal domain-containing protein [Helicobacter]|uniref:Class II aldolase and adducin N-terminal domain-containing protein n=1 Tax=Helicobacter colisuis TaxID=2949739 RepID=A0ABT0TUG8_9HELI|nr:MULTISPECIES: class II aldolase and adducin N-terminal domain-containing protein [Helicobacter]MCI2235614.1 class II aldolase and adducin N-terminal domain-containing protein [Helicobacter sp. CaF467b]MCI7047607.1 class II aldolase and adducin N-terminal domain-containing protein [Helicobacter sp.]MCI7766079.1 class II aldolase and adducin N-terminal domain-containing protein [Helicobacter sp.]MCL9819565.1 class II aldolase and adducin N-terminal domain-containing protein [Helicobacter colis
MEKIFQDLKTISLAMFRKNFFGIFHGSISTKLEEGHFLINKKDAIFDDLNEESLITLYHKQDYRWQEASMDAFIHSLLYQNIPNAKYIAYGMPPFTIAYTLSNSKITPKDYFGYKILGTLEVYDPKDYDNWYERADVEINRYFKENDKKIMVIKGYGVYVYHRDLQYLSKLMAILENSCKVLHFHSILEGNKPSYELLDF